MSRRCHPVGKWIDRLNECAVALAQVALLILLLFTTYAVIARYFFRSPSIYATEVCVYLLLLSTWFSVGYIHRQDRHVRVDVFQVVMRPSWRRCANVISGVCIVLFCVVLVWAGYMVAETAYLRNYRSTSVLRFPLWITYGLIPVGGLLLGLTALQRLFGCESASQDSEQQKEA